MNILFRCRVPTLSPAKKNHRHRTNDHQVESEVNLLSESPRLNNFEYSV